MRLQRLSLVLLLATTLLGGSLVHAPGAHAVGAWTPTSPLSTFGILYTATLLPSGRVLVTGIVPGSTAGPTRGMTQVYDPANDRWADRAALPYPQGNGAPTLLPDGRVLFTGGTNYCCPREAYPLGTAQVYDPVADTWTPVASLGVARQGHTATTLPDGTVLVVGGERALNRYYTAPIDSVERYDARSGRWSPAARLPTTRSAHTATLLRDGRNGWWAVSWQGTSARTERRSARPHRSAPCNSD